MMRRFLLGFSLCAALAACATAPQTAAVQVPDYMPRAILISALANGVGENCADMTGDPAAIEAFETDLDNRMAADGLDKDARQRVFMEIAAEPETYFRPAYQAFMAGHGENPDDGEALCRAVRAERAQGSTLGQLVRAR